MQTTLEQPGRVEKRFSGRDAVAWMSGEVFMNILRRMRMPVVIMAILVSGFGVLPVAQHAVCPVRAASEGDSQTRKVDFLWAFGAVTHGKGEDGKIHAVKPDTVLRSGDRIRMMIELREKCFVYVIHRNPQDEVFLLFPYEIEQFGSDYRVGKTYFIPGGDSWFELDGNVGRETFYIFASLERMSDLDGLFSRYASAADADRPAISREILAQVQNLKSQNLPAREMLAQADQASAAGGAIRGIRPNRRSTEVDLPSIAEEVRSEGAIFKTVTIEHR